MDHSRVKHYVSIVGILGLACFGAFYLWEIQEPKATIVLAIITAMAGLGGYNLHQREDTQ